MIEQTLDIATKGWRTGECLVCRRADLPPPTE
jgi:hypothetical protein